MRARELMTGCCAALGVGAVALGPGGEELAAPPSAHVPAPGAGFAPAPRPAVINGPAALALGRLVEIGACGQAVDLHVGSARVN